MATQDIISKESRTLKMVLFSDDEDQDDDNSDMVTDSSSDNGATERCAICLGCIKGDVGSPDAVGCDHYFCLLCILEWAKNNATCPQDRRHFNKVLVMPYIGGSITEKIPIEVKKEEDAFDYTADDLTYCEVCGSCEREDCLLLCDGCDLGYHLECLTPPLSEVPIEEWFCPSCVKADLPSSIRPSLLTEEKETSLLQMFKRPSTTSHKRLIPRTRATERVIQRIHKSRGDKKNKKLSKRRKRRFQRLDEEDYSGEKLKRNKQSDFNKVFPTVKKYGSFSDNDVDAQYNKDEWANKLLSPVPSTSLDNESKKFKALTVLKSAEKPCPSYQGHSFHPKVNLSLPAMPDILTAILGSPSSFISTPVAKPLTEEKKKNINLSNPPKLDYSESSLFLSIPLPTKKKENEIPENLRKKGNIEKSKKLDDDLKDSDVAYDPMDVLDKFDDVYDPLDDLKMSDEAYDPMEPFEKSDEASQSLDELEISDVIYDPLEKLEKSEVTNSSFKEVKISEVNIKPLKLVNKSIVKFNPLDKLENSKLSQESVDKLELVEINDLINKKEPCKKKGVVNNPVKDSNSKLHKKIKSDQNGKNNTKIDGDSDKHLSSSKKLGLQKVDKLDKDKYDTSKYKLKHSEKVDKYDSYSKDTKHKSFIKGEKLEPYKDGKFNQHSKLEKYNSFSKGEKYNSYNKDEKYKRYSKDSKYVSSSKDDKYKHDYYKEKSSQKYYAKSKNDRDRSYSIDKKRRKQRSRSSSSSSSSSSSRSRSSSRSKSRSKRNRSPDLPDTKRKKTTKHSSKHSTRYHSKSPEIQKKKKLKSSWGHYYSESSDSWIAQPPKEIKPSKHSVHSMDIPSLVPENKSTLIILSPDDQSNDRFSDSFDIIEPKSSTPLGVVRVFSNEETSSDLLPFRKERHKIKEIVLDDSNSNSEILSEYSNKIKPKSSTNSDVVKEKRAKSKKSKKKSKSKKKEKSVSNASKDQSIVDSNNFTSEVTSEYDTNKEKELVDSNIKILTDASNIKILTDAFINEMAVLDGKKFFETKDIPGLTSHSELFPRESIMLKPFLDTKIKTLDMFEDSEFGPKDSLKLKPFSETKAEKARVSESIEIVEKKKPPLIKNNNDSNHSKLQLEKTSDIDPKYSEKGSFKSMSKNSGLTEPSLNIQSEASSTKSLPDNRNKKKLLLETSEVIPYENAITEESLKDKNKKQNLTEKSEFGQNKPTLRGPYSESKSIELLEQHELGSSTSTLLNKSKDIKAEKQIGLVRHDPVILKPYLTSHNDSVVLTEPSKLVHKDTKRKESDFVNINKKPAISEISELTDPDSENKRKKLGLGKQPLLLTREPSWKNYDKYSEFAEQTELIIEEPSNLVTSKEIKINKTESSIHSEHELKQIVETSNKTEELLKKSNSSQNKSAIEYPNLCEKNEKLIVADKHELVDSEPAIIKDYLNEPSHSDKFKTNLKLKDKHKSNQAPYDSLDKPSNFENIEKISKVKELLVIDKNTFLSEIEKAPYDSLDKPSNFENTEKISKVKELLVIDKNTFLSEIEKKRQIEDAIKLKKIKDVFGSENIEEGSDSPYDPCQEIEGSLSVEELSPYSSASSSPTQNIVNLKNDISDSNFELNSSHLSKTSTLDTTSSPYSPSRSPSSSPEMKIKYSSARSHKMLSDSLPSKNIMTYPTVWNDKKICEMDRKPYKSEGHLYEDNINLAKCNTSVTENFPKINVYGSEFQAKSIKGEESKVTLSQREICNQKVKSFFVDDGLQREICDQTVKSFFDQFASPVKFDDSDSDDTVRSKLKKIDQNINQENVSHNQEWSFNISNDSVTGTENKKNLGKKTSFMDSFIDSMESPESPESDGELTLPVTLRSERKRTLSGSETRSSRRLSSKNKQPVDRTLLEAKVVEEAKRWLNPYYIDKCFSKEIFKEIMAKIVKKVVVVEYSLDIQSHKIQKLVDGYVQVYLHRVRKKKKNMATAAGRK